jgi:lipopolysaccharide export system protein LptA
LKYRFKPWERFRKLAVLGFVGIVTFAFLFLHFETASAEQENAVDAQKSGLDIKSYGSADIDLDAFIAVFTEDVKIALGPTEISADKIVIYLKDNTENSLSMSAEAVERVIATGNVEIVSEFGIAAAQKVVYDTGEQSLVLTGEPATFRSEEWKMAVPLIRLKNFVL